MALSVRGRRGPVRHFPMVAEKFATVRPGFMRRSGAGVRRIRWPPFVDEVRVIARDDKVRRRLTPRFFIVLAVFLITVYLIQGYARGFVRMRSLQREITRVRQEIADLELRNEELERRIALYESDAFVERAAREELGLVNPGEIPVIVVDEAAVDLNP